MNQNDFELFLRTELLVNGFTLKDVTLEPHGEDEVLLKTLCDRTNIPSCEYYTMHKAPTSEALLSEMALNRIVHYVNVAHRQKMEEYYIANH